jgi:hypothetical protein
MNRVEDFNNNAFIYGKPLRLVLTGGDGRDAYRKRLPLPVDFTLAQKLIVVPVAPVL